VHFVPLIAAASERGTKPTPEEHNVPRGERERARGTKPTTALLLNAAVVSHH